MTLTSGHGLLARSDSLLAVIDVQDAFLAKLPPAARDALVTRIRWIIDLAAWCEVPLLVTAEARDTQPLNAVAAASLPDGCPVHDKRVFGLAEQGDLLAAVNATGRRTVVLVGLETDVCIAHSALGLLARGFRVAVVHDATASPGPGHEAGLARIEAAGGMVLTRKMLFYEWLRTLDAVARFHAAMPHMRALAGETL